MCLHVFFIVASIFCLDFRLSLAKDVALVNGVSGLRKGEDGRGSLLIDGQQREVALNDQLTIRVGSIVVSGFGMIDIINSETAEAKQIVIARLPHISLTADVEIYQSMLDASTSGEAMIRFLDAKLVVKAVVVERSVEEVEVAMEAGALTTAFDLEDSSPSLQAQLREIRKIIEGVFEKMVVDKIAEFLRDPKGERLELFTNVPAAPETSVQKANRFVDKLLADNRQALHDAISVVTLPDESFTFEKKILLVTTHGYAKLTKGHLDNLHGITRKGDCVIFAQNDALNVVINLGIDNVQGGYYIDVGFGVFGASSDLELKIESVQLIIKGLHSFREIHGEEHPDDMNILNFDLALNVKAHLGYIDIDVNVLRPLDWLFNFIAEKVVSILKGRIQGMIKDPIRDAIRSISGGQLKF